LIAEAALPGIVLGLYVVQRPWIGNLGKLSALVYAYTYVFYTYVFYTFSVAYALLHHTRTYGDLTYEFSPVWLPHGALFLLAGLAFG
jgi:hypothetical protein